MPPALKIVLVLGTLLLSIIFINFHLQVSLFFIVLFLILLARLPLIRILKFGWIFFVFSPIMLFMYGAFYHVQDYLVFKFLVFGFYHSGLLFGLTIVFRLFTIALLIPFLVMTTRTSDMLHSLERYFPKSLLLGLALALRFIPMFEEEISNLRMAGKARASRKGNLSFVTSLLVLLFSKVLKRSRTLSYSIESRGFKA